MDPSLHNLELGNTGFLVLVSSLPLVESMLSLLRRNFSPYCLPSHEIIGSFYPENDLLDV